LVSRHVCQPGTTHAADAAIIDAAADAIAYFASHVQHSCAFAASRASVDDVLMLPCHDAFMIEIFFFFCRQIRAELMPLMSIDFF